MGQALEQETQVTTGGPQSLLLLSLVRLRLTQLNDECRRYRFTSFGQVSGALAERDGQHQEAAMITAAVLRIQHAILDCGKRGYGLA